MKILLKTRHDKNPFILESHWDGAQWTVLHRAAYCGHLDIIKWYKEGLNFGFINPEDNKGRTPLSLAIQKEKLDVIEYFIELGLF